MRAAEIALQSVLLVAFILFIAASFSLVTIVYTVTPFSAYGIPVEIEINIGMFFILLALATLTVFLWRRTKK